MNKKYTPGPWVVCPKVALQIPVASVAMEGLKLNVAHVAGIRNGEGAANARLIAAAPDLLAALDGLLAYLDGYDTDYPEAAALFENARAVVAKATGAA